MGKGLFQLPLNEFILDERIQGAISKIDKDPAKYIDELVIAEDTAQNENEKINYRNLIERATSRLPVQTLKRYERRELPATVKAKIDEDPEAAFIKIYNEYMYNPDLKTKQKLIYRNALLTVRNTLEDKGIKPQELLESKNVVYQGLKGIGNILGIGTSAVAKGVAKIIGKDSEKLKIWGGEGYKGLLDAMESDPKILELIQKKRQGELLNNDDISYLKKRDTANLWKGLAMDIVLDPANLIGAVISIPTKLVTKSSIPTIKIIHNAKLVNGKVLDLIDASSELKSVIPASTIKILEKSANEVAPEIVGKQQAHINTIVDGLKTLLDDTKDVSLESFQPIRKMIVSLTKDIQETSKAFDILSGSPILTSYKKVIDKVGAIKSGIWEGTKLRKLITSDVPLTQAYKIKVGKDDINKIGSPYKTIKNSNIANRIIVNKTNNIIKAISKNKGDIIRFTKKDLLPDDVDDIISEVTENKELFNGLVKNTKDLNNEIKKLTGKKIKNIELLPKIKEKLIIIADKIHKHNTDQLMEEIKSGGKIITYGLDSKESKLFEKLSREFHLLNRENKYDRTLPAIENELRSIIHKTVATKKDGDIAELIGSDLSYLTHVTTPQYKQILNMSPDKQIISDMVGKFVSKPGKYDKFGKQRNLEGTINIINKASKSGKAGDLIYSPERVAEWIAEHPEWNDVKKAAFINSVDKLRKEFNGIKGKFFENNMEKILSIRGIAAGRAVEKQLFEDGIAKFGVDNIYGDAEKALWKKPIIRANIKAPAILADQYFHPEIVKEIENLYSIANDPSIGRKILNSYSDLTKVWKGTTLNTVLSTPNRDVFGNIMNSLLSVDPNPAGIAKYFKALGESLPLRMGKLNDIKITSKNGMMYSGKEFLEELNKRGIDTSTEFINELNVGLAEKTGKDAINNIPNTIRTTLENVTNSPVVKTLGAGNPIKFIMRYKQESEYISKIALALYHFKEGKNIDEAVDIANKYLFDYSDQTKFSDNVRKYVYPFFTWVKNNLPLQLEHINSLPTRSVLKSQQTLLKSNKNESDKRNNPAFISEKAFIPIGKDKKTGLDMYMNIENFVPYFEWNRINRMLTKIIGTKGEKRIYGMLDEIGAELNPFIKLPIEFFTGRDFQTRKPIQTSKYATKEYLNMQLNPYLVKILNLVRPINIYGDKTDIVASFLNMMNVSTSTQIKPDVDSSRFMAIAMLGSQSSYDPIFSKKISSQEFKNAFSSEYYNYKQHINSLSETVIGKGGKLTEKDKIDFYSRMKRNILDIYQAYDNGLITEKEKGTYLKQFIRLIKPLVLTSLIPVPEIKEEFKATIRTK